MRGLWLAVGLAVAVPIVPARPVSAAASIERHERDSYDDGECRNSRCDGDYDNENSRHRNRGAFSPGPFDRSPIEMHDVCISLDCSGRDKDRKDQPPPDQRPQSLFPPTPEGIRQFVVQTIQAGIEMGRLFADTTITFVSNLLVGIA